MSEWPLYDLNDRQQEAVITTEGFIRVIAGAGAGKTKALTHRYAYLVKEGGIHPGNILCVTFTNKAAGEMKRRVRGLIGDGYDTSLITTYHGFCVRVLRADMDKLFYPQNFLILDRNDQKTILQEIYDELELKLDHASFQKIFQEIGKLKADTGYVAQMVDPNYVYSGSENMETDARIILKYLQRQKKVFGLDFDDLVNFTFYLFDKHKDVLEKWQQQLHYIQVDEFQDSSHREMRLLDMLAEQNGNLFVVGDPDQNIYEWRGARVEILVDFDKRYAGTQTIILNQNYRSTPQILAVANDLIDKNKFRVKKDLFTESPNGTTVIHLHAKDEKAETEWIVCKIKKGLSEGRQYSHFAMLYRASFLSRYLEQAFIANEIPYQIWGSVRFFDRMEIRDMLAYLRMVIFRDDVSFLRIINVPRRRMGKTRVAFLRKCAEETGASLYDALKINLDDKTLRNTGAKEFVELIEKFIPIANKLTPSELLQKLMAESGYEKYIRQNGDMERLDNLAELNKTVVDFERGYGEEITTEEYLRAVALLQNEDTGDERDAVKLMTVHASKGLEFPCVFVVGLNEGIFPSSRTLEERMQAGLEEERRLCFVAMTRAREELYLTESEGYNFTGGTQKLPSRFLFDVNENLYKRVGTIPGSLMEELRKKVGTGFAGIGRHFEIGVRVGHPLFGDGTIIGTNELRGVYDILFDRTNKPKPIKMDFAFVEAGQEKQESKTEAQQHEISTAGIECELEIETETLQNKPATAEMKIETVQPELTTTVNRPEPVAAKPKKEISKRKNTCVLTDNPNETNLWKRSDVPHSGWICDNIFDLGKPSGVCGMCGHQVIRYVHVMYHPQFSSKVGAGCVCAGRMEDDLESATRRERDFKKIQTRRKAFQNRKWKTSAKGNLYTNYNGNLIVLLPDIYKRDFWKYRIDDMFSQSYPSLEEAKQAAFDAITDNHI